MDEEYFESNTGKVYMNLTTKQIKGYCKAKAFREQMIKLKEAMLP